MKKSRSVFWILLVVGSFIVVTVITLQVYIAIVVSTGNLQMEFGKTIDFMIAYIHCGISLRIRNLNLILKWNNWKVGDVTQCGNLVVFHKDCSLAKIPSYELNY